jgi:hypothetical protein
LESQYSSQFKEAQVIVHRSNIKSTATFRHQQICKEAPSDDLSAIRGQIGELTTILGDLVVAIGWQETGA